MRSTNAQAIPEASYLMLVLVIVLPLCLVQLAQFLSKDLNIHSAARLGMCGACSTRCVSMRSCSGATSRAASSFTSSSDLVIA